MERTERRRSHTVRRSIKNKSMKFLKYFFYALITLASLFVWVFPQLLRCFCVEYDNFLEIKPNIFVEEKTSKMQQDSLIKYVENAKMRLKTFWGSKNGQATIIFSKNPKTYQKYAKTTNLPPDLHNIIITWNIIILKVIIMLRTIFIKRG